MDIDFTKDYSPFGVEDFAADDLFRAWVIGKDPKATAFWKYWVLENPTKRVVIEQAEKLLLAVHESQAPVADAEIENAVDKIFRQIDIRETGNSVPTKMYALKKYYRVAAMAATVLLAVWGTWWWFSHKNAQNTDGTSRYNREGGIKTVVEQKPTHAPKELIKKVNDEANPLSITLDDGSVVVLNRGSQLTYPSVFDEATREVKLEGTAFFEVTKNPSKPFLVHAKGVVTKVLGTSFIVNASNKNVKVTVKTGKVAVYTDNNDKETDSEKQAIVLTPNQEAVFQSEVNRFKKSVQETPSLLITNVKIKDLHFDDAPLPSVLNALEEAYGIEIIFDEDILKNCMITTSLTDEPLFEKLTIICKTIGASYRELDAKIIIEGRGCR